MKFVRIFVSRRTQEVRHVMEQDTPFSNDGHEVKDSTDPVDAVDLGFVEDFDWRDRQGLPCTPSMHLYLKLENPNEESPRIHDCPCTMNGIRKRLRERGQAGIPIKARAWLALVLPEHRAAEMGIGGAPLAALKALENVRARRDPESGSRVMLFERAIQQRADLDARKRRLGAAKTSMPSSEVGNSVRATVSQEAIDAEQRWLAIKEAAVLEAQRNEDERLAASKRDAERLLNPPTAET